MYLVVVHGWDSEYLLMTQHRSTVDHGKLPAGPVRGGGGGGGGVGKVGSHSLTPGLRLSGFLALCLFYILYHLFKKYANFIQKISKKINLSLSKGNSGSSFYV